MHISILALNDTSSVFSHNPINSEEFSSIGNETGLKKCSALYRRVIQHDSVNLLTFLGLKIIIYVE